MKKPNNIKKEDIIAISSMSDGILKESKQKKLFKAIKRLETEFTITKDEHITCSVKGESCDARTRAKDFMKLVEDKNVKCIIGVTGGNYLIEVLDYLNFDLIKKNVKWIQGQSDITILLYLITTKYDIQTIYSYNVNSMANISDEEYNNNILVLKGEKIIQNDFKYQLIDGEKQVSHWVCKQDVDLTGRIIGGCLECLMDLVGTEYDYTTKFIEKYKNDGIIWYFDIDYMNNEQLLRNLWHLQKLGWFKYSKCIILGRVEETSYTGITLDETLIRGLRELNVPIITNFDLGHTYPRITIVNGSIVRLICNEKEHKVEIIN